MAPRPESEPFRAEFQRRIVAWRAALLGVPSGSMAPPTPGPPWASSFVQTPARQAALELRRPQAQFWQPILLGGVIAVYMCWAGAVWGVLGVVATFAAIMGGAVLVAFGRRRRQLREAGGRSLNSAFNLIGLGRLRDASEILDEVELRIRDAWALRLVDIQRAIIAIRRGDMAPAEVLLTSAIERPVEAFARDNALYQLEGARALRAFVRAALGKHEEARADIAEVLRGNPTEDASARVTLSEAMILEQQGKREELRLLLTEKSTLLLEHTHPRERAIVRAFQRMVRSSKASVYRRAEPRREKTEGEEPMLADWVAKVAPGAATFVRSSRSADQTATVVPAEAVAQPSEAAIRANQAAKKPVKKRTAGWVLGGAAASAAMIGAIASLARQLEHTGIADAGFVPVDGEDWLRYTVVALVLMLPATYALVRGLKWLGRARAERSARSGAKRRSTSQPSREQLSALAESQSPVIAAQAWLMLADRAERRGDFVATLDATTRGLARLSDPRDRMAADIVYPDLLSLRAFALAANGRAEESNAELAMLGPSYPHFSRAVFRARLVTLARAGNARGAAAWVEQGEADLPLSVREELLADLVRAAVHPEQAGAGEIQRLKDELASMPEVKSWVRTIAPGLLETFEGAGITDTRMRIDAGPAPGHAGSPAPPHAEHLAEHLAEDEAAAELEAPGPDLRHAR